MPWGRMDDKFWRNRKVRALRQTREGREALGAWAYWWSWCLDDPALDGVVPKTELANHDRKAAKLLVDAELWHELPDGFRIHDFHNYNPTRTQVEAKRMADRERIAAERDAERHLLAARREVVVARESRATSARVASTRDPDPIPDPKPDPDPTLNLFPRAVLDPDEPGSEGEGLVSFRGAEQPREDASGPEATEGTCAPGEASQRAARAAWGGNGVDLSELDGLEVLDDVGAQVGALPPDNQQGVPIHVIRPLDDDPRDFAHRVRNRFQKLYEDRFRDMPNMGGKAGADFPLRLARTAHARGLDPFELLAVAFEVFARLPRDEFVESYPYATFASRFGRYLNKPAAQALDPKAKLRADIAEALATGDRARYSQLDAQYRAQFLGGRDARPAY